MVTETRQVQACVTCWHVMVLATCVIYWHVMVTRKGWGGWSRRLETTVSLWGHFAALLLYTTPLSQVTWTRFVSYTLIPGLIRNYVTWTRSDSSSNTCMYTTDYNKLALKYINVSIKSLLCFCCCFAELLWLHALQKTAGGQDVGHGDCDVTDQTVRMRSLCSRPVCFERYSHHRHHHHQQQQQQQHHHTASTVSSRCTLQLCHVSCLMGRKQAGNSVWEVFCLLNPKFIKYKTSYGFTLNHLLCATTI